MADMEDMEGMDITEDTEDIGDMEDMDDKLSCSSEVSIIDRKLTSLPMYDNHRCQY